MALFGRDYDRDYGYRYGNTYGAGYRGARTYDRDYGYFGRGRAYDDELHGYKSRWETDYGDPFGDRSNRTPIRMIRGEYGGYDRGYRAGGYDRGFARTGYDRTYNSYGANPMSYDPYYSREGTWGTTGYDRGYRANYGRGYDRGWF